MKSNRHKPALMSSDKPSLEWSANSSGKNTNALATDMSVCWDCHRGDIRRPLPGYGSAWEAGRVAPDPPNRLKRDACGTLNGMSVSMSLRLHSSRWDRFLDSRDKNLADRQSCKNFLGAMFCFALYSYKPLRDLTAKSIIFLPASLSRSIVRGQDSRRF